MADKKRLAHIAALLNDIRAHRDPSSGMTHYAMDHGATIIMPGNLYKPCDFHGTWLEVSAIKELFTNRPKVRANIPSIPFRVMEADRVYGLGQVVSGG